MKLEMKCFLSIFLFVIAITAYAQKTEKVIGQYSYYVPENVTLEEAKRTALIRAQLTAIADAFGTIITQSNSTIIRNQNEKTDSRFFSLSSSEVKGEWIETTREPEYEIKYEGDMLVVSVEVRGLAREFVSAGIDFTAKILRNGTEDKFESSEFRSGDDMYLYFKSPIDGYLVVYMLDEIAQKAFCLLPYKTSGDGAYRIEHDHPYILFSAKNEPNNPSVVDEYVMTCSREIEFNNIYIIFSPNPFTRTSSDEVIDDLLPRQLSYIDFQKWILNNKKKDKEISCKNIQIKITDNRK